MWGKTAKELDSLLLGKVLPPFGLEIHLLTDSYKIIYSVLKQITFSLDSITSGLNLWSSSTRCPACCFGYRRRHLWPRQRVWHLCHNQEVLRGKWRNPWHHCRCTDTTRKVKVSWDFFWRIPEALQMWEYRLIQPLIFVSIPLIKWLSHSLNVLWVTQYRKW